MATKLSIFGEVTQRALSHKVSRNFGQVLLQDHLAKKNYYLSTTIVIMATKIGRVMTYIKGLLIIMSYYPLIKRSCKITLQN